MEKPAVDGFNIIRERTNQTKRMTNEFPMLNAYGSMQRHKTLEIQWMALKELISKYL